MLDYFCIASKGGLILWSKTFSSVPSSLVNSLISDCLIPAKSSDDGYTKDSYRCKWILANEVDLVFVAVYQRILQLPYIDDLLEAIRNAFLTLFEPQIRDPSVIHSYQDFDEKFEKILYAIEDRHAIQQSKQQKTFKETKKFQNSYENVKTKGPFINHIRGP
ncbi:Longin-like domain-containing protein [Paraphysoderma sedebokerense]|nr:Longin-like domain-containing protein [Paraphysoderma sedebokerense]